jgi:hypothetical protein
MNIKKPGMYRGRPCTILRGPQVIAKSVDWMLKMPMQMLLIKMTSPSNPRKIHTVWVRASRVSFVTQ